MSVSTVSLPAGEQLTIIANAVSSGRVWRFSERVGDTAGLTAIAAGATVTIGPYAYPTRHAVETISGSLTLSMAPVDFMTPGEVEAKADERIQALAPRVYGTIGDLIEIVGEGVPTASAQATANVNPTGDDNSLTFTAKAYGESGNDISVVYVDPEDADVALGVELDGSAIIVTLSTDGEGAITATAAEIKAAIEAHEGANALVTVAVHTADSGSEDDGSGVVTAMAAVDLEGGDGLQVGVAGKGSRYTDVENGTLYLNTGTKAQPVWTQLAPVA